MKCKIDGCEREARYRKDQICQMHYFRMRRTGSYQLNERKAVQRRVTPNGYVSIYAPGHPLANGRNFVFEHRAVMFERLGDQCAPCEMCGVSESWRTCHVDHIDNDRQNNCPKNLRILCRGCNVSRGFSEESFAKFSDVGLLEFDGKRATATGWARDPRVHVTGATIRRRKREGMSDYDALFAPKITHKTVGAKRELQKARGA